MFDFFACGIIAWLICGTRGKGWSAWFLRTGVVSMGEKSAQMGLFGDRGEGTRRWLRARKTQRRPDCAGDGESGHPASRPPNCAEKSTIEGLFELILHSVILPKALYFPDQGFFLSTLVLFQAGCPVYAQLKQIIRLSSCFNTMKASGVSRTPGSGTRLAYNSRLQIKYNTP